MTEYDVKKALHKRGGQVNNEASSAQSVNGIPNSVLADVFAGKRGAPDEMLGHRAALAPSIAAKMSRSFGMDVSAVQVYRSDAMAGTEMHGMAQGNKVVLSSDVDLNTLEGQAVLGHELSHIRAQSMGMGSGRGLLQNGALERQADTEGMLAARGMSIGGESMGMSMGLGMAGMEGLTPLGGGLPVSAAAPMQAAKGDKEKREKLADKGDAETYDMLQENKVWHPDTDTGNMLDELPWLMGDNDFTMKTYHGDSLFYLKHASELLVKDIGTDRRRMLQEKTAGLPSNYFLTFSPVNGKNREVKGFMPRRVGGAFEDSWGKDHTDEEILQILHEMTADATKLEDGVIKPADGYVSQNSTPADSKYDAIKMHGINLYRDVLYAKLKKLESEFGTILTQMHPRDVINRLGGKKIQYYSQTLQDAEQLFCTQNKFTEETQQYLAKGSNNPKRDAEMQKLLNYYGPIFWGLKVYPGGGDTAYEIVAADYMEAKQHEADVGGPRMDAKQLERYNRRIQTKIDSGEYMERPEAFCKREQGI